MAKWNYFRYENWNYLLPETSGSLLRFIESELDKDPPIREVLERAVTAKSTRANKIIWLRFCPESGHFSASLMDKRGQYYTNMQGERIAEDNATCLTYELVSTSGARQFFSVALEWVMRSAPSVAGGYQLYHHRFLDPSLDKDANQYVYVGITSRSWKDRWSEHLGAASRGSSYIFHAKIREAIDKHWIQQHSVNAVGLTEEQAMNAEELAVADYALYPDNPRGMNMIPGGYAGIRALHRLGALGTGTLLRPDERARVVENYLREHPKKGVPNPLIAARWDDEDYAASVICGHHERLSVEQVRHIRQLSESGFAISAISALAHARNIDQVKRVLGRKTYNRIR